MSGGPYLEDRGLEADATELLRELNREMAVLRLQAIYDVIGIPTPTSGGTGRSETLVKPSADEPGSFHPRGNT